MFAGFGLGLLIALAGPLLFGPDPLWILAILFVPIVGVFVGWFVGRPGFACAACKTVMANEQPVCPRCGVALPETLVTANQEAARRAEFAAQAEAADADLAAEAESASSDQV